MMGGGGPGYAGKRDFIPEKYDDLKHGTLSLKSLYSMIRPRRQILGGGGDGGDSVIFVHPGGSQSPVGPNVRGESPLAGLVPGAGIRSNLGSSPSPAESPAPATQGNAFVKSGLSGLGSLSNNQNQDGGFGGMSNSGIPSGLAGLGGLSNPLSGMSGNEGGNAMGGNAMPGGMGLGDDSGNGMQGSPLAGGSPMGDSGMGGSSPMGGAEGAQNTHGDESFPADSGAMNMGAMQNGGQFGDEPGHSDEQSPMNYQRSAFPASSYVSYFPEHVKDNIEEDVDESTERDVKSTILRDDEDEAGEEGRDDTIHVRVHKDYIPRPEDFGY